MEESGGRDLIAHEMGLGKTVCALMFLVMHPEACKFLVVCKSTLKTQWQHETMRWMGEDVFAQIVESSSDFLLPGAAGYIVSYDLLQRMKNLPERISELGIKTIILDECQQIKNVESQRTKEVRALCSKVDYVFPMSGTPIKNNAAEYFPVLNILNPAMFSNFAQFQRFWCDSYYDGYKNEIRRTKRP